MEQNPKMSEKKPQRSWIDYWQSVNQILVVFGVGLSLGIYGPSLIDLAEIYSSAPNEVALMYSARALGMFLGSCFGVFFFARMNDQILIMITMVVYGVQTALIPLLPNITSLHILGFVGGAAIGISNIGSQVRLVKVWTENCASAIQSFHTAFGVGAMIGPFVGAPFLSLREDGLIIKETQLHIPYAAFGALFFLILLSMIGAYCVDPSGIDGTDKHDMDNIDSSKKTFEIILMAVLFFYITVCDNTEVTFSTLISVYAVDSPALHFSKSEAAYLAGIFWTTFTGGRIISIFIAAFFDLTQLLLVSHFLLICASGILVIFNNSAICTWIGVGIMGLGVSSLHGSASGYVFQYLHIRHLHVSMIRVASCLGIAISAYFVPPVVEKWPLFLQYFTASSNVLHFLILLVMLRATKGKETIYTKKEESHQSAEKDTVA